MKLFNVRSDKVRPERETTPTFARVVLAKVTERVVVVGRLPRVRRSLLSCRVRAIRRHGRKVYVPVL